MDESFYRYAAAFIAIALTLSSLVSMGGAGSSSNLSGAEDVGWRGYVVIGDALAALPWLSVDDIRRLKEDYGLEGIQNSVGVWIDYRSWLDYPRYWNTAHIWAENIKSAGMPAGFTYGYHVGDSFTAGYDEAVGFLHYYRAILGDEDKWRYPNGSIAPDPYTVGASRSFSGYLVIRVLGDPMDIERYKRVDFYSTMQPQNPYWRRFFADWGFKAIEAGADAIFLDGPDGIFTFFWGGGWGCNDTWEGLGLAKHLIDVIGVEGLRREGVSDPNSFCLREYLVEKYGGPSVFNRPVEFRGRFKASWPTEIASFPNTTQVLRDPIFKQALIYWYRSAIEFAANITGLYKGYASKLGRSVFLTSNTYHSWVPHITLAPYMDAVQVETSQFKPPPYVTYSIACKLGLSSVNYTKPTWISEWILNFANPYEPSLPPSEVSDLIKYRVAEAYASGCVMLVPFGTGHPSEGWPPSRLVYGSERNEVSAYYRFIGENRGLFSGVVSIADVALLVSLPTAVWNFIPPLGVFGEYEHEVYGWARILEFLGIPYDALWAGFKGLLETDLGDRVGRYRLLIAPHATHISDRDLEAITRYMDSGGVVVATQDFALFDELGSYRDPSVRGRVMAHRNLVVVNSSLGDRFYDSLVWRGFIDQGILGFVGNVIRSRYGEGILRVQGLSPVGGYISVMGQPDSGRITMHIVNYAYSYNSGGDWFNSTGRLAVELKLPPLYRVSQVLLYSPDSREEPVKLNYTISGGWLRVEVPRLNIWDIVVVEPIIRVKTLTATTTTTQTQVQRVTVTTTTQIPSPVPVTRSTTVTMTSERTAYTAVTYTSPYPVTVYSTATAREVVTQERTVLQPTPVPVVITLNQPTTITAAGGGAELLIPAALGALVTGLAIGYLLAISLIRRR